MADPKTVLLIDDNGNIRAILANHLEAGGFRVAEAVDGESGLARAREGGIDLIFLDVMMPNMDGLQVLHELKADPLTVAIPVVIVSAFGMRENVIRATREGAVDFIVKPFNRDTVMEKVHKFIPA